MDYSKLKKELGHKERTINDLISYIRTRTNDSVPNYSLLLGAGASYSSDIRTGGDLVDEWRKDIYSTLSGKNDYTRKVAQEYLITNYSNWYSRSNEYSSLFEYKFDLPAQRRRFVEQEVDGKLPSIGYSYLVSLSKNRYFDTVYTTNFDDLLNESFYQFSETRPLVCAHDSSLNSISVNSSRPKIIKLHGDYLFDDIKSTLRETESLETNTKEKFIQFSKEYGLIVIGYAGNDRSIMDVINYLLKTEEYLKNGIYWCVREDDYINPELTKLLWKEKVYFVKIDGFDEALAEIHDSLKTEFSLDDNFIDSKKESIISTFTKDKFQLSKKSELIKRDIDDLIKHKDNVDISNLIRELNEKNLQEDQNNKLSEKEFKLLLTVERLVRVEDYVEAKKLIKSHLSNSNTSDTKEIYTRKLIEINRLEGSESEALELCDELIKIDSNNVDYYLLKAKNFIDLTKRCEFIEKINDQFDKNYGFQNYVVANGIRELKHTKESPIFNIDTLLLAVNASLKLEPSLENPAWEYKITLIELKYNHKLDEKSKNEKTEQIRSHVAIAGEINNTDLNYLRMILDTSYLNMCYEKALESIGILKACYSVSAESKKATILNLLCDVYPTLNEYKNNGSYKDDWLKFIEGELIGSLPEGEKPVSVLIMYAKYSLKIEKDDVKCLKYIREAAGHHASHRYAGTILSYLELLSTNYKEMHQFLNKTSGSLIKRAKSIYKSEIYTAEGRYDEATKELNNSYKYGGSLNNYLTSLSFILLKDNKYQGVINLVDSNISKVSSPTIKDMLTINRELASKKIGGVLNEVSIRNIIGRAHSEHLVLAAECLMDNKVQAVRLLKKAIEKDYMDYFAFQRWPVIPSDYISECLVSDHDKTRKNKKKQVSASLAS